jgi:hypothetical protein
MGGSAVKMHETDIGRAVVAWLTDDGWDVYQEVHDGRSGRVVDVVAVRGKLVYAVECKTSFGLAVLAQAHDCIRMGAHLVAVACPQTTRAGTSAFEHRILADYGIGRLFVNPDNGCWTRELVHVDCPPRLHRTGSVARWHLDPEQRTFCEAGSACGGAWSPWKRTCRNLREIVERRPGIPLAEAMREIEHHYGTDKAARANMMQWLRGDVRHLLSASSHRSVPGVILDETCKPAALWPESRLRDVLMRADAEAAAAVLPSGGAA